MFSHVVGQESIKEKLLTDIRSGKMPHALLFSGPEGCGKLALALGVAQYMLCEHPTATDACGICPSCKMMQGVAHPDLHFVFPIVKYKKPETSICDVYINEWRKRLQQGCYFDLNDWLEDIKAENQQATIYEAESGQIQKKLALKSTMGGYKVLIVWMPEKMNHVCANKLLKLIEEPPAQTLFLFVSNDPEKILPTILSRTQRIEVKGLPEESIAGELSRRYGMGEMQAAQLAHLSKGSFCAALKNRVVNQEEQLFFDLFVMLMRLSYMRNIREMRKWSEQVAAMGREKQKNFLTYCQRLIRENFIYNFQETELNYMAQYEQDFAKNFARFVNERNVIKIMDELSDAQRDIEQNTNPKMVFFDFSLKMIVLLIQ